MSDLTRMERLVYALIEDFHVRHGVDAEGFDGTERRMLIWELSSCHALPKFSLFEEILDKFEEIDRLKNDDVAVSDGDEREVWPNEHDYCTVRDAEVLGWERLIATQIRELLA